MPPRSLRLLVLLAKIGITLGCILAALIGFELYLRANETRIVRQRIQDSGGKMGRNPEELIEYGPYGRRWVPNAKVEIRNHWLSEQDVKIDINSLGFRDREVRSGKAPGELRVVVLGDSITAADYLGIESTFVDLAERHIASKLPGRKVELVNTGISNTGLREQVDLLAERGVPLAPELVLVNFYMNDSRPPWGFAGEIGNGSWLRRHSIIADTIYRRYKLRQWENEQYEIRFKWIDAQKTLPWKSDPAAFAQLAELARFDWGSAWQPESWDSLRPELDRLSELKRLHGFEVAFAVFPVSFQVYADFLDDAPQRALARELEGRGFHLLDLLPAFRERADRELFYDHCHPNREMNAALGPIIGDFILSSLR